jgi:ribosomal protein S12 methylthiotransferase
VPEEVKDERWHRLMQLQQRISAARLRAKVGRRMRVLVDRVEGRAAIARSESDAPEIDGIVRISGSGITRLAPGEFAEVEITAAGDYDLEARLCQAPR